MILVTGATGFIGSHLTERLAKGKEKIRVLVRDKNEIGYIEEFDVKIKEDIEIVEGDLSDKESLLKATKDIEKVFHLAAISRPMNIETHVYYDINVTGTRNLLEACEENKVKKIVHVSSMSVFGFSRDGKPLNENSPRLPVSEYGKSKKEGEELVIDFCKKNKIELVVVRPPMVYGGRDMQFFKLFKLINTGNFPLIKQGKAKIEFCFVKNLVEGIVLADERGKNLEGYNISNGETYSIKQVFSEISKAEGKRLFPISIPYLIVKIAGSFIEKIYSVFGKKAPFNSGTAEWMSNDNEIDMSKAKKELGYKIKFPLEKGIKETVDWYKDKGMLK